MRLNYFPFAAFFIAVPFLSACSDSGGGNSGSEDTTAPEVSSVSPADGATGVDPEKASTAEFNEDVLGTSVEAGSVHLTRNGEEEPSSVSFNGNTNTVTITPEQPMALLGEYKVTLDSSIADLAGNSLESAYSWSFAIRDGEWRQAETIETKNGDVSAPEIAFDDAGNAIAVWQQDGDSGSPDNIRANRYTLDNGWGSAETIELQNAGEARVPQIAFDNNGNAIAVWHQDEGSFNIRANRYTPDEGWGAAQTIETNPLNAQFAQIALDADGNALAVWEQWDSSQNNIRASRYTPDNGWGSAQTIESDNSGNASDPQIAFDGSGNAIAVWEQSDGTRNNIRANRYTPETGWGAAETIEDMDNGGAIDPQIGFDDSGNALAVWAQDDGTHRSIRANRFSAETGWETAETIENNSSGDANSPQIAVDNSGNALAVWYQDDGSRDNIQANRYTPDNGWGTAQMIESDNAGSAYDPQIAIDGSGNALAVWQQGDGTSINIRANRYTTADGWGTAETIETEDTRNAEAPQVAVAPFGNGLAVWFQDDGARNNARANRFD